MKSILDESSRVSVAVYSPRINIIQKVVAEHFSLTLKEIQAHRRNKQSILARQRVHYFCREFEPGCPLKVIGIVTGNGKAFDHSSICHSINRVNQDLKLTNRAGELVYPETAKEIEVLRLKIRAAFGLKPLAVCACCGQEIPVKP